MNDMFLNFRTDFRNMAARAYLCWRWAACQLSSSHEPLARLFSKTRDLPPSDLDVENTIPEMEGFHRFMLALTHSGNVGMVENLMFDFIVREALQLDSNTIRSAFPQRILDFGCGKCSVLNRIGDNVAQKKCKTQLFGYMHLFQLCMWCFAAPLFMLIQILRSEK